jgi:hypothetical protein
MNPSCFRATHVRFLVVSLAVLAPSARPCRADAPERPVQSRRDAALDAAVSDYEHHRYDEARANFLLVHQLEPTARTSRALGKVEFELRNYGEAARHFRAALESGASPLSAEMRREVEALLDRCNAYLGQLHVTVDPSSATIVVDGVTVATGPEASLSLVVGDHILEIRASGRHAERRAVRIEPGRPESVHVILSPAPGAVDSIASEQPTRDSEPGVPPRKRWIWGIAGGVFLALAAVGIAVAASRGGGETRVGPLHGPDGVGSAGTPLELKWGL